MRSNKIKAAMLGCSLCCLLLCVALLLPLTMGKYGSKIDGFISFDAGSFNAAITQTETLVSDGEGGTKSIFVEYSVFDFKPGMSMEEADTGSVTGNTAATTKFRIANGNSEADAASTPLQYTIRIRTSHSLPLKYTLKSVMEPAEGQTEPTVVYHMPLAEPTVITEALTEPRYEYQFSEVPTNATAEEDTSAEGEVTPLEGEPETPVEYTEVTFRLEQGTADSKYVYREHELIAEWSAEEEFAQSKYMKEVELVEILVTVVSINKTEDGYDTTDPPGGGGHANGIVIVSPASGASVNSYKYEIDLRSFKADEMGNEKGSFVFTLNNGFGLGLNTDAWAADYTMTLKMPADLAKGYTYKTDDGKEITVAPWTFKVYRNEIVVEDMMVGAAVTYTVRDLKTGKDIVDDAGNTEVFAEYEAAVAALNALYANEDTEKTKTHAVYVSYKLNLGENNRLFYQQKNTAGNYELASDKHGYTIRSNQCLTDMKDEVAFLNKLELVIETKLVALPAPTPPAETTEPLPEPTE